MPKEAFRMWFAKQNSFTAAERSSKSFPRDVDRKSYLTISSSSSSSRLNIERVIFQVSRTVFPITSAEGN
ncbi:unnamed protein product [Macrosiphum euphorbiae]|uniref:Uncharacterized protein n=1 Tax=Macrosiphum euphorbiae TaxID=13131 RepID=A0AAV0XXF7_9HEMI|nr:unnamed protein product [Macrosiphum euphorbiae]